MLHTKREKKIADLHICHSSWAAQASERCEKESSEKAFFRFKESVTTEEILA